MERNLLDDLSLRLRPTFEKHHVLRAIIFGSVARGEASRRSDLDLIIVQQTDKRFLERYDDLLSEIVRVVPGMDVDLLIYTPQELRRISDRPLIKSALTHGKVIYESHEEPQ
jgi:predicted nucleotidyltransferase